jgi:hypothetical protein
MAAVYGDHMSYQNNSFRRESCFGVPITINLNTPPTPSFLDNNRYKLDEGIQYHNEQ